MTCHIQPLGHRVLVELDTVEETTKGGIILKVDVKREQKGMEVGTVKALGPNAFDIHGGAKQWGIKEGDRVYFPRYEGKYVSPSPTDPDNHSGYRIIEDELIYAKEIKS